MPNETCPSPKKRSGNFARQSALASLLCCYTALFGQVCPPNIDFEKGTLDNWTCYVGTTGEFNGTNRITLDVSAPSSDRHTVYTRSAANILDPYGKFPVICPNGSGYSIKLGNNLAGTEAEGISYEFTIPPNRDVYSLIYHYAVVFQDPSHQVYQQPRMEIEIINVTDNTVISCSSFTFFPNGSPLPGFFMSDNPGTGTPVWCKNWSAVSVNLDGNAGKTIRLFFKTADCTFRRHFGYAYIDVNSECSGEFTGAAYCPGDSAIQVEAPHGYQHYTWYNEDFSQVLGTTQTLTLRPAPPAGTNLAVQVQPYFGYGCTDTLFARLTDTLSITAQAGDDKGLCFNNPVQIGVLPKPGVFYHWSPHDGLDNTSISNPFANPETTTNYVLTSRSFGGGCVDTDTVLVKPVVIDTALRVYGKAAYCLGSGDSCVLHLPGADEVQWYRDNQAISGANGTSYRVTQSGTYYATIGDLGCTANTVVQPVLIEPPQPGIAYPVQYVIADSPAPLQARTFGDSILWQPSSFLNTVSQATPVFSGTIDQFYTISIRTAAGCLTVDSQQVKIVKSMDILVPTAFTPNRDGLNDVLRPTLFGMKELRSFRVYNRWGQLLFQTAKVNQGWDGIFAGKVQANQVVVWVAEAIGIDGKQHVRKGTSVCIQ